MKQMLPKKEIISQLILLAIISIFAFIFSLECTTNIWKMGGYYTDSAVFRTVALTMSRGGMPYLDTFDHKGPLLYLINYLGMQIGYSRGVWLLEYASILITFIFLFKIARIQCNRFWSIITLLLSTSSLFLYFEGGNLTEEYAMPFISISLFIFLDYFFNDKVSPIRIMICGFCFGAVCLLRINMISVWIVFCIAILIDCLKKKQPKK